MTEKKQKKSRWLLWVTILSVLLMLVSPLILYRCSNRAAFNRRVEKLKADGYPVSLDDLEAAYILPPNQPNAADIYLKAFAAYVEPNKLEQKLLPVRGDYESSEDQPPYPDDVIAAIKFMLDKNQESLDLLDQADRVERCLFPRVRDGNWFQFNESLSGVKKAAMMLVERNLYLAQTGQTGVLFESTQTGIGLTRALSIQPQLIEHLVNLAIKSLVSQSVENSLNLVTFTDEQLNTLQQQFKIMQTSNTYTESLITERAEQIGLLNGSPKELVKAYCLGAMPYKALAVLYILSGLKDKDSVLILDHYEKLIVATKRPIHEQLPEFMKIDKEAASVPRLHYGFHAMLPALTRVGKINLRIIGYIECAETALAIERYRLKYHALPDSLDVLVPEFIETVYLDPFDGKPLRYMLRDSGGYTVYCIGEDGIDNGGLDMDQMRAKTGTRSIKEYDHPFTVKH